MQDTPTEDSLLKDRPKRSNCAGASWQEAAGHSQICGTSWEATIKGSRVGRRCCLLRGACS